MLEGSITERIECHCRFGICLARINFLTCMNRLHHSSAVLPGGYHSGLNMNAFVRVWSRIMVYHATQLTCFIFVLLGRLYIESDDWNLTLRHHLNEVRTNNWCSLPHVVWLLIRFWDYLFEIWQIIWGSQLTPRRCEYFLNVNRLSGQAQNEGEFYLFDVSSITQHNAKILWCLSFMIGMELMYMILKVEGNTNVTNFFTRASRHFFLIECLSFLLAI